MLRPILRSPWQVPFILAVMCFLASGFFCKVAAEDELEAAIALEPAPAPAPVAVAAENPLVPATASLRPTSPQPASEAAPAMAEPAPVDLAVAEPALAEVAPAELAPAEMAAAEPEPAEAASSAGFLAALPLPGFGNLALLGSVAGAVLLSIAAFALMRGRQAEPPHVFAGKDPWERLARDARGNA